MARPNLSYLKKLILALFGVPCGCLTGMAAISNGQVVVPGLRFLLGQAPDRAAHAALMATCAAGIGALLPYQQNGFIGWKWVFPILIGQTIGGIWAQKKLARGGVPGWTPRLGAVFLVLLGLPLLFPSTGILAHQLGDSLFRGAAAKYVGIFLFTLAILSIFVGFAGGLIRTGGVLLVLAEVLCLRMPVHLAQGTAIAVLILAAAPVLLARARIGAPGLGSAAWVPFGAFFGGLIGAHYAVSFSDTLALITVGTGCLVVGGVSLFQKAA